jgi:hypothetical protein
VGVRIEIVDAETGLPLSNVSVRLKGWYVEEQIGPFHWPVIEPKEPQQREFEMSVRTGRDGVVVFALGWRKRYPWDLGRPEPKVNKRGVITYRDVHSTWIRPVDDVEKARRIEIRHPRYAYAEIPFTFEHLLEFGQDPRSEFQEPRLFDEFEAAWQREIDRPGVRFFVLDLGTRFPDFQNKRSTRAEFFEKILRKDFGTVYTRPHNWFSWGERPQSECGPYFAYLLKVELTRRSGQLEVTNHSGGDRGQNIGGGGRAREEHRPRAGSNKRDEDRHRGAGESRSVTAEERRHAGQARQATEQPRGPDRARRERSEQEEAARERQRAEERKRREAEENRRVEERKRQAERAVRQHREKERAEKKRAVRERRLAEQARRHPIGVAVETMTKDSRRRLGLYLGTHGVVIRYVAPSSPAARAGLRAGMVIESVDHRVVNDVSDLDRLIGSKRPGSEFSTGIWRKNRRGVWERASKRVRILD